MRLIEHTQEDRTRLHTSTMDQQSLSKQTCHLIWSADIRMLIQHRTLRCTAFSVMLCVAM